VLIRVLMLLSVAVVLLYVMFCAFLEAFRLQIVLTVRLCLCRCDPNSSCSLPVQLPAYTLRERPEAPRAISCGRKAPLNAREDVGMICAGREGGDMIMSYSLRTNSHALCI
jgi:hypothetical protein